MTTRGLTQSGKAQLKCITRLASIRKRLTYSMTHLKLGRITMSINRLLLVGTFVFGILLVGSVNGQGMPDNAQKALDRLVGTWKCEDRCGDTVVKGDLVSQWNADKTVLTWYWTGPLVTAPDRLMTSAGIMGWDGREKAVKEHCFASTGESFSASHRITADKWESQTQGTLLIDGKFHVEKSLRIATFKSPDEWQIITTKRVVNGKEQPDIVSRYNRVK